MAIYQYWKPGNGGIGGIIRNGRGDWIIGFSKSFTHATNNLMEMCALKKGLELVIEHNLRPLEINMKIILQKGNLLYDPLINHCRSTLRSLGGPTVQHSFREQNRVADMMAEMGATLNFFDKTHVFVTPPLLYAQFSGKI
ncbi:uncharacterized protein LOC124890089 [Capsicum annuum]|uniref:uncharacterized protein LOC124890089 n=1 Tax=Capsicum annuum TaxID=4072 RepID=UPI001FB13E02|nr:uncharacterized protein LOC124890089 [Capsicum annuum]